MLLGEQPWRGAVVARGCETDSSWPSCRRCAFDSPTPHPWWWDLFRFSLFTLDISLGISLDISLSPSGGSAVEPSGLIVRAASTGIDVDWATAGVNSVAVAMAASGAVVDMYCFYRMCRPSAKGSLVRI